MTTETLDRAATDEVVDAAEIRDGKAVVAYTATEQALHDLRHRYEGVVFDCTTKDGEAQARAARKDLVTLRTALEACRRQFKAPALEFGRLVDGEAARITAEIVKLEEPIDQAIRAEEQRREQERQRRQKAEQERKDRHQRRIAEIRAAATGHARSDAATLLQALTAVQALDVERMAFEEFAAEAEQARAETIATLTDLHSAAAQREADAAAIEAERQRLKRAAEFQERLNRIALLPSTVATRSAAAIQTAIDTLGSLRFDTWEEYASPAEEARAHALTTLRAAHADAVQRERQQDELQRQREAQEAEARRLREESAALESRQREVAAAVAAPIGTESAPIETKPAESETPEAQSGTEPPRSETPPAAAAAAEPEPATKLTELCSRFGPGFSMTSAFVDDHLGVQFARGERGSVLFTPAQVRECCAKLAALASRIGSEA